jgi:CBS domain-containing protein
MTIADILRGKGHQVVSVGPRETLLGVCAVLAEHRIGAVLVRDPSGRILGILSERDVVRALAQHGGAGTLLAEQVMTREVRTIEPGTRVNAAMALMTEGRFRHLPVTEHGRLAGMVSIGDLVKARIAEAEAEAEDLRAFVVSAG